MADIKVEKDGNKIMLHISGELAIEYAAEFRNALVQSLGDAEYVVLDLANVTFMDLSCLQLLCSAHRSFAGTGKAIVLEGRADTMKQAANDAGFHRSSGCMKDTEQACFWKGI